MLHTADSDTLLRLHGHVRDYLAGRLPSLPTCTLDEARAYFGWLKTAVLERDRYINTLERELFAVRAGRRHSPHSLSCLAEIQAAASSAAAEANARRERDATSSPPAFSWLLPPTTMTSPAAHSSPPHADGQEGGVKRPPWTALTRQRPVRLSSTALSDNLQPIPTTPTSRKALAKSKERATLSSLSAGHALSYLDQSGGIGYGVAPNTPTRRPSPTPSMASSCGGASFNLAKHRTGGVSLDAGPRRSDTGDRSESSLEGKRKVKQYPPQQDASTTGNKIFTNTVPMPCAASCAPALLQPHAPIVSWRMEKAPQGYLSPRGTPKHVRGPTTLAATPTTVTTASSQPGTTFSTTPPVGSGRFAATTRCTTTLSAILRSTTSARRVRKDRGATSSGVVSHPSPSPSPLPGTSLPQRQYPSQGKQNYSNSPKQHHHDPKKDLGAPKQRSDAPASRPQKLSQHLSGSTAKQHPGRLCVSRSTGQKPLTSQVTTGAFSWLSRTFPTSTHRSAARFQELCSTSEYNHKQGASDRVGLHGQPIAVVTAMASLLTSTGNVSSDIKLKSKESLVLRDDVAAVECARLRERHAQRCAVLEASRCLSFLRTATPSAKEAGGTTNASNFLRHRTQILYNPSATV